MSTEATDSSAPAAPSACPIIDFVEVIHGNLAGGVSSASAHAATSRESAPVAVRCPLMASISSGATPASCIAAPMQRRMPSGFGAVMLPPPRWPPQLTAAPRTSAWMRAPRVKARSRLSSTSTPAPHEGTKPPAEALIGRGPLRLVVEAAAKYPHGVEARPDVVTRALRPPAQHPFGKPGADALEAEHDRLGPGRARARVRRHLVAERQQARHSRRNAARHHLLDRGGTETAHLARIGERHQRLAHRVQATDSGAEHRAGLPVDFLVARGGAPQAGILPRLERREAGVAEVGVHGEALVFAKGASRDLLDA